MPILAWFHSFLHFITGGLDCLIILLLFIPYIIYKKFTKKDWSFEKILHCNKNCKYKKNKGPK